MKVSTSNKLTGFKLQRAHSTSALALQILQIGKWSLTVIIREKASSRKFDPLLPISYRRRRRRERRRPWPRRTRRRRPSVRRSRLRPRPLRMMGPAPAGSQSSAGSPFLSFCLCFNSSFFFAVPSSAFPTHIYLDREHQFQSSRAGEIEHMFFVKRLEWLGA